MILRIVTESGRFWRRVACIAISLLSVMVVSSAVLASYSGLTLIPTADLVEPGGFGLEAQFDGALDDACSNTQIVNTQFGLGPRFEAGLDFDLTEDAPTRVLVNLKYLAVDADAHRPAIALGICNVGHTLEESPYAVATFDCDEWRVHLGAMRIEDQDRCFAGFDCPICERLNLMCDYISGDENFVAIGCEFSIGEGAGILIGVQFPNAREEDNCFTLHIAISG